MWMSLHAVCVCVCGGGVVNEWQTRYEIFQYQSFEWLVNTKFLADTSNYDKITSQNIALIPREREKGIRVGREPAIVVNGSSGVSECTYCMTVSMSLPGVCECTYVHLVSPSAPMYGCHTPGAWVHLCDVTTPGVSECTILWLCECHSLLSLSAHMCDVLCVMSLDVVCLMSLLYTSAHNYVHDYVNVTTPVLMCLRAPICGCHSSALHYTWYVWCHYTWCVWYYTGYVCLHLHYATSGMSDVTSPALHLLCLMSLHLHYTWYVWCHYTWCVWHYTGYVCLHLHCATSGMYDVTSPALHLLCPMSLHLHYTWYVWCHYTWCVWCHYLYYTWYVWCHFTCTTPALHYTGVSNVTSPALHLVCPMSLHLHYTCTALHGCV
jgi:hypothetical protein